MRTLRRALLLNTFLLGTVHGFEHDVRPILERSCVKCHGGEKLRGKVNFAKIRTQADADRELELWETVRSVLDTAEMPPDGEPPLSAEEQRVVLGWIRARANAPIEARPSVFRPRRLSGPEYRNTLRSLFGFDLTVGIAEAEQTMAGETSLVLKLLPTDPPGASGFVNDTHEAPLSTVLWNEYLHLADAAIEKLFSRKGRPQLAALVGIEVDPAVPSGPGLSALPPSSAESLLRRFVPRAFRRPVPETQLEAVLASIRGKEGEELLEATKLELRAVLMSPAFLYRGLLMDGEPGERQPVDAFEMAERLSYFLWEDRPDDELTALAIDGSLSDPAVVASQVERMLAAPAARSLAESFGVQWLGLDALDGLLRSDPIRLDALKTQPIDFLHHLFTEDRPVMELVDSRTTFANANTAGFYGKDRSQMTRNAKPRGIERQTTPNQRLTLRHTPERGGILTMPGILTMNRGPILRGAWILRRILGERLGEPPADVPPIQPVPRGKSLTFRERFARHREDATCARCHDRIDPLGFALDAYDANGRFASTTNRAKRGEKGRAPDTSGTLPTGETFASFSELKTILTTTRRESIVRNIVERTLSYALCRKLGHHDRPTVDEITRDLVESDGTWKSLFVQVATSLPFRETIIEKAESDE